MKKYQISINFFYRLKVTSKQNNNKKKQNQNVKKITRFAREMRVRLCVRARVFVCVRPRALGGGGGAHDLGETLNS